MFTKTEKYFLTMNKEINVLIDLLKKYNLTIGSVESITCGLFASTFGCVSGVSSVFKGSLITYQNEAKNEILNISNEDIDKYGVVSNYIAGLMAMRGAKILKTNVVVSFTGNAGPSKCEGEADVGTVFMSIIINDKLYDYELSLSGDREEIRKACVEIAVTNCIKLILKYYNATLDNKSLYN